MTYTVRVTFDIRKVDELTEGGNYALAAWKTLWKGIRPSDLSPNDELYCGDAMHPDGEFYVIAVRTDSEHTRQCIVNRIASDPGYRLVSGPYGVTTGGETNGLLRAGVVTDNREYQNLESDWAVEALSEAEKLGPPEDVKAQPQPQPKPSPRIDWQSLNGMEKEITFTLSTGVTMKFVAIPSGSFLMGDPDCKDEWTRQHHVTIARPFWLATVPVTQEQWLAVMGGTLAQLEFEANAILHRSGRVPKTSVSWHDCQKFIKRLSETLGVVGFRLPSEAEWEYACRAGTTTLYHSGNNTNDLAETGWYHGNKATYFDPKVPKWPKWTQSEVALKKKNAWGLYDMHGNVEEWCSDWFAAYPKDAVVDPLGPNEGTRRVTRGGSASGSENACTSAARSTEEPHENNIRIGLRLVYAPRPEDEQERRNAAHRKQEEQKRLQEEEAEQKRLQEEERKRVIQNTRREQKQCIFCGGKLTFLQRILGHDRHGTCSTFKD